MHEKRWKCCWKWRYRNICRVIFRASSVNKVYIQTSEISTLFPKPNLDGKIQHVQVKQWASINWKDWTKKYIQILSFNFFFCFSFRFQTRFDKLTKKKIASDLDTCKEEMFSWFSIFFLANFSFTWISDKSKVLKLFYDCHFGGFIW